MTTQTDLRQRDGGALVEPSNRSRPPLSRGGRDEGHRQLPAPTFGRLGGDRDGGAQPERHGCSRHRGAYGAHARHQGH